MKQMKPIMSEAKQTLASRRNRNRKNAKLETKNVNNLLNFVKADNITELNRIIYTREKVVAERKEKNEVT